MKIKVYAISDLSAWKRLALDRAGQAFGLKLAVVPWCLCLPVLGEDGGIDEVRLRALGKADITDEVVAWAKGLVEER